MKQSNSMPEQKERKRKHRIGAPPGPRKANLRRAALIDAAGKLFVEKGYDATTMDEIAAAAGFAKGTLYHYFANKADLLLILREGFDKEIVNRIQSHVESCPTDDWRGRIRAWIDAAVDAYFDMSELHDVVIYGAGMPFRHAMADSEITRYLARLIGEGAKAGAWRVDDERWTAVMMFYSFRGGCDEAMVGTQRAEDLPGKLNDVFLRMLGVCEQ
ncbi:TetR/AcrR family transcriptional regulator [Oceanidesulfovibrio marinus]|uniref:TetR/AcrR family transcriptional regulator n=1 Tax=Oceanidesulfovibrio marinus TaxID=370038 RepID=A0A6P1ZBQ3_9BACT|nr:TetR/AcrR family transcriptional regulator [Oceanidesulfovibrio marinus]TVM30593.1 TetR/AcrR family transcriptional regulator [Oceanidesulfovibrio marinus]